MLFRKYKEGFEHFLYWISETKKAQSMEKVIVGMEPTGHYWFNLAHILKENEIKFVAVNIYVSLLSFTFSFFFGPLALQLTFVFL
ncbi:transposase [Cytobacillus firmus]|uniref:Transposase n=2 Tax=Cytobacillus TaxID=2675230 RepID=A0A366JSI1_CYTFI|nr:transposase [Cytobacillus firmus]TDX46328.1 transposase [Cytobacillus oceanisediminis]